MLIGAGPTLAHPAPPTGVAHAAQGRAVQRLTPSLWAPATCNAPDAASAVCVGAFCGDASGAEGAACIGRVRTPPGAQRRGPPWHPSTCATYGSWWWRSGLNPASARPGQVRRFARIPPTITRPQFECQTEAGHVTPLKTIIPSGKAKQVPFVAGRGRAQHPELKPSLRSTDYPLAITVSLLAERTAVHGAVTREQRRCRPCATPLVDGGQPAT